MRWLIDNSREASELSKCNWWECANKSLRLSSEEFLTATRNWQAVSALARHGGQSGYGRPARRSTRPDSLLGQRGRDHLASVASRAEAACGFRVRQDREQGHWGRGQGRWCRSCRSNCRHQLAHQLPHPQDESSDPNTQRLDARTCREQWRRRRWRIKYEDNDQAVDHRQDEHQDGHQQDQELVHHVHTRTRTREGLQGGERSS